MSAGAATAAATESVYVLQLQHGKFYVGKTCDLAARLAAHKRGEGAEWTKEYPMTRLLEARPCRGIVDESLLTEELMTMYGIDQVRGAEYTKVELPAFQRKSLEQKFSHLFNVCFNCKLSGHYAQDCTEPHHGHQARMRVARRVANFRSYNRPSYKASRATRAASRVTSRPTAHFDNESDELPVPPRRGPRLGNAKIYFCTRLERLVRENKNH